MSDELEHVDAGSETSGADAVVETSQEETTAAEPAPAEVETPAPAPAEAETPAPAATEDAGVAAEQSDAARTDFVKNARHGDECLCPDGRKGTVHRFDEGLVCIPNADQG